PRVRQMALESARQTSVQEPQRMQTSLASSSARHNAHCALNEPEQRSRYPETHDNNHQSQARDGGPLPAAIVGRRKAWVRTKHHVGDVDEESGENRHEKGDEQNG